MDDLISRQDAIKAIDEKAKRIKNEDTLNGLAGAVGILFDLPSYNSIKTELSGDLISRQALLDDFGLSENTRKWGGDHSGYNTMMLYEIQDVIESQPPVTQKSGVWVEIDDEPHEVWECDHCGFVIDGSGCIDPYDYRDTYKFCPNCGCRMVEPQESEEI